VLHNTIANPSFEYDSGVISKIFGKSYTNSRQLGYWNAIGGSTIAASTDWASQGNTSLKISKGISSGAGVEYYPRSNTFATPTLTATSTASDGTIPNGTVITFAVMGLTDIGLSLASSITDTQSQPNLTASIPLQNLLYPSIDSRRGHSQLWYAQTTTSAANSKANIAILDNSTSKSNYPRGWAIWYSTNATLSGGVPTNGTFVLAGVVPNQTSFMNGTITVKNSTNVVFGTNTNFTQYDQDNLTKLYTTTGALIGTINSYSGPDNVSMSSSSLVTGTDIEFRTTTNVSLINIISGQAPTLQSTDKISISPVSSNTINRTGGSFTGADIGKHIYIKSDNNQFLLVGTIQTVVGSTTALLIHEAQFSPVQQLFYISSETNPQSFPENNQGAIRMFTVTGSVFSPPEIKLDCTAPFWGITNSSFGGFTHKHHLYLDWYLSADNSLNPNATYTNTGADWSVYLYNNYTSTETLLGKLDSTGTTASAKRMGLRTKFLIDRPADHTEDMRLRIKYTGASASDAVLYIDGVQFVDVGMIWRAYDWYGSNIGSYSTPPQFEDWNWDDVEFSYIDGDTPGALWSDTMPTQSGTYTSSFPYFTNAGVWMRDFYEYETPSATTSAGGYAGPRFRLNYQWRNSASPVYGVSVPGLSQSSMQTQTFSTGFWAPLSTDNINVVVEPSISGVGMPEVATTSIEYGIVDGGYVQRQVARMRNLQFTITISAKSWTGLHANRRSLINLLKFDQLSQQGERKIRYRGADIPLITSVTYQSGLEYSGTQGTSFTEALALRFLATDPYFYAENAISTDVSPSYENQSDFSHVMYKIGRDSSWMPLSHRYYTYDTESNTMIAGSSYFYDSNYNYSAPYGIGWIQSPSGNVTALVVSGTFSYPANKLAIFYVSGYDGGLSDSSKKISSLYNVTDLGAGLITTSTLNANWSIVGANQLNASDVGKFIFTSTGLFVGKIDTISSYSGPTTGTFEQSALQTIASGNWYLVSVSSTIFQSLPNNVYLYNLFSVDSSTSIVYTYQESSNSVIVYGDVTSIVDMGANQPFSTSQNLSGKGYVYSETTNPNPIYKNRIFRISMNDNGKISTEALDDVFSISETETSNNAVIYESSFYKIVKNIQFNDLAKSSNNYTLITTVGNTYTDVINYDNTMPYAIDRSISAFSDEGIVSSVLGIDPLGNPISVGVRQALPNPDNTTVTTYIEGEKAFRVEGVGTNWDSNFRNFSLYTRNGLFVGKIAYVQSPTLLFLAEPANIKLTKDAYQISTDVNAITFDKKSINSNVYVAQYDVENLSSSNKFKTAAYGYFNNPNVFDSVSIIAGSKIIASTSSFFTRFVQDTIQKPQITFTGVGAPAGITPTTTAKIDASSLITNKYIMKEISVGTYVIDDSTENKNRIIGCIAEIVDQQTIKFRNVPSYSGNGVAFTLRSTIQLVDVSGYKSLAGNLKNIYSNYIAESEFAPKDSYTNAFVPNFIVPSINSTNGVETTYKIPYLFADAAASDIKGSIQTSDFASSTIARRGVFETYGRDPLSLTRTPYRAYGFGTIVSGHDTPLLVARAGANFTTSGSPITRFYFSAGAFAIADVGKSVYSNTKQFLGVIASIDTTNNRGEFLLRRAQTINTSITPLVSNNWWPFQFKLREKINDEFYANAVLTNVTLGQGLITTGEVTASSSSVTIPLNAAATSMYNSNKVMCLYAYINSMWRFNGRITAATASNVVCGGGILFTMPANTIVSIAPAVIIMSGSARSYKVGQELHGYYASGPFSGINYLGTIQKVIEASDSRAVLAIMPYTYSQTNTPDFNQWSMASANGLVWIGAKQYKGGYSESNFFANPLNQVVKTSTSEGTVSFLSAPYQSTPINSNVISPGVLRGVISTSTTTNPTKVAGFNTAFNSAGTNNPLAVLKKLYSYSGALIGTIASPSGIVNAAEITLTTSATMTQTGAYYRVGEAGASGLLPEGGIASVVFTSDAIAAATISSTVASGTQTITATVAVFSSSDIGKEIWAIISGSYRNIGVITGFTSPTIVVIANALYTVAISGGTNFVLNPLPTSTIALNTFSTASTVTINSITGNVLVLSTSPIADKWIGRALYMGATAGASNPSVESFVGVIASIKTNEITLEAVPAISLATATPYYVQVAAYPVQWTFAPGDMIRNIVVSNNVSQPGTLLGQIYNVDVVNNRLTLTKDATSIIHNAPIVVQRGKGIGRGNGYITEIIPSLLNGTFTINSNNLNSVSSSASVFVSGDVGKSLYVYNPAASPVYSFVGVIATFVNSGLVTLTNNVYGPITSMSCSFFTDATLNGEETFFSTIPFRPLIGSTIDIYVDVSSSDSYSTSSLSSYNSFVLVGQLSQFTSQTSIVVKNAKYKSVSNSSLAWYYVVRNVSNTSNSYATDILTQNDLYTNTYNDYLIGSMSGLGTITGTSNSSTSYMENSANMIIMNGANQVASTSIKPTQFTYQVSPGDIIAVYNSSNVLQNDFYRVVEVLSDYAMVVSGLSGGTAITLAASTYSFVIFKSTDEMAAFDRGVTAYTNNDWQDLGYTDKRIDTLASTSNGDIYAGGQFTQWAKQSSTVLPSTLPGDVSDVKRIAKIVVGLNGYNYVSDAYGAPIAGSSFTNNGFADQKVQHIVEASEINPLNGYMSGYDSIMVGGTFTATTDNTPIKSGLAYLPSSSIANSMRQIVSGDLSVVSSNNTDFHGIYRIATTNRLRSYNDLVTTNVLDGINGMNVALLFDEHVTVGHTTKYFPVRIRGNASCYPIINISYFTTSNIALNISKSLYSLEQTETGAKIYFTNNELRIYNGEVVTIDFRIGKRTINSNIRGNLSSALNPNSNFVDFILLGANNSAGLSTQSYDDYRVNVIGVDADYGITVTVSYIPRFWSFDANNLFFGSSKAGL
jgi:hypothetical protein